MPPPFFSSECVAEKKKNISRYHHVVIPHQLKVGMQCTLICSGRVLGVEHRASYDRDRQEDAVKPIGPERLGCDTCEWNN